MRTVSFLIAMMLAVMPAMAQYRTGAAAQPVPEKSRLATPAAEITLYAGTGLFIAGFIIGGFTAGAEDPSKPLVAAGSAMILGGGATMVGSLAAMAFHSVPSYRIGYCGQWAAPAETQNYRRACGAAKAISASGLSLFAAGMAADLLAGSNRRFEPMKKFSDPLWITGLCLVGAGIGTFVVADNVYYGQARRGWEAKGRPQAYLSFGAQSNGYGLAYTF